MSDFVIEAKYPLTFREEDARTLGQHLKNRHSVVMIGMKRVGISNFLRFFLHHKDIVKTYIDEDKTHLFIPVDLSDLVEREVFPFWTLTLKRIDDAVKTSTIPDSAKKDIEALFLDSIQSQDLFLTIDRVRKAVMILINAGVLPTIFFIRFDRLKDAVTHEFFDNLIGLKDASHEKLSYVFTSYRGLAQLSPTVFTKASVSVFAHDMYIKPGKHEDIAIIYESYKERYKLNLSSEIEQAFFDTVDGYVQYLQYGLINLHENKTEIENKAALFERLVKDERIALQSEELWESLDQTEQAVLLKVSRGQEVSSEERDKARYIWDMGFVIEANGKRALFSPLFDYFLKLREKDVPVDNHLSEFTKKENALFLHLKEHQGEICEREQLVEAVWPEAEAFGVSDWAIDRLVARVRSKLKLQKGNYEIQTIKTRGYKLIAPQA